MVYKKGSNVKHVWGPLRTFEEPYSRVPSILWPNMGPTQGPSADP